MIIPKRRNICNSCFHIKIIGIYKALQMLILSQCYFLRAIFDTKYIMPKNKVVSIGKYIHTKMIGFIIRATGVCTWYVITAQG